MSSSKSINELLSQLQTQIKTYKNRLSSNNVSVTNECVSNEFLVEDGYVYDAPAESEYSTEYSNKEIGDDQGSIKEYVLKCACHAGSSESSIVGNTSIIIDGEPKEESGTSIVGNTSVIEPTNAEGVIEEPTQSITPEIKKTDKEKSFFG